MDESWYFNRSGFIAEGATNASGSAQVIGLHSVFIFLGIILLIGMCLSIFAWIKERQITSNPVNEMLGNQP